jgi:hypothetical protein
MDASGLDLAVRGEQIEDPRSPAEEGRAVADCAGQLVAHRAVERGERAPRRETLLEPCLRGLQDLVRARQLLQAGAPQLGLEAELVETACPEIAELSRHQAEDEQAEDQARGKSFHARQVELAGEHDLRNQEGGAAEAVRGAVAQAGERRRQHDPGEVRCQHEQVARPAGGDHDRAQQGQSEGLGPSDRR